jgi:FdhD protein
VNDGPDDRAQHVRIERLRDNQRQPDNDILAVEEPLEIRVGETSLAVTMRTPGHDQELAAGFLLTEGLIDRPEAIARVFHCRAGTTKESANNIIVVELSEGNAIDVEHLKRNFYATSSCGICGKASIEQVCQRVRPIESDLLISTDQLKQLPGAMRSAQKVFGQTGGLHAAAIFTVDGQLRCVREDIGRHNAVDKVIGWALLNDEWPLNRSVMMVSGRAGFEIVQKALVAGIPIMAAVSAPSSLAVSLAVQNNLTLVGFLRDQGMNIYAGGQRIR